MGKIITIISIFLVTVYFGISIAGFTLSFLASRGKNFEAFWRGSLLGVLPDGLYTGSRDGYVGSWKGKKIIQNEGRGINLFSNKDTISEKYPFVLSIGKGLKDRELDVLKLDYNLPDNPFWLRPVLDELVEVQPGKYLGKVHYRLYSFFPFTLGYFKLDRAQ